MQGRYDKKDDKKNVSIDAQIIYVNAEILKLTHRIDKISHDFGKRRENHENFAFICMFTIVGWSLYPFEGVAFLTDLSITSGRLSYYKGRVEDLKEQLIDLQTQKTVEQLPQNGCSNVRMFAKKSRREKLDDNSKSLTL